MNVFLSPLAAKKIENLLNYIEEEWSLKAREEFLNKLTEKFNQISKHPKSCVQSKELPNLYKAVITKQSSVFYRINSNEIEVITIFDNRQNPDQIKEEIKTHFR